MQTEKEQLQNQIKQKKAELKPLEDKLRDIYKQEEEVARTRVTQAEAGKGDFKLDELIFSATNRCACGAGIAYPKDIGVWGSWICSDILRGLAIAAGKEGSKQHSSNLPFSMYEIKSEDQPSANSMTTRPSN